MEKLMAMVPIVAETPTAVLLLGETGTGKEVLARTLHGSGPRKDAPFVAVNCGALPESLLESELFGYKKGAFTGAEKDKPGRFALAEGGTLFLDEIGEISQSLQVKLLRVLQEHEYEPLGGTMPVKTDVRIICATNRDLKKMVDEGNFRRDLYYRINVITLQLPPLKDRKEDIPALAYRFLSIFSERLHRQVSGFAPEVFASFYAYSWPGNIRELENVIERAVVLAGSSLIGMELLPPEIAENPADIQNVTGERLQAGNALSFARNDAERECILSALDSNGWKRAETAKALGMDKATLYRKMKKLEIGEGRT
jgi:transcriptional regulator with PAS, ATPase and Fis domain